MSDKFTKDDFAYLQHVGEQIKPVLDGLDFETYPWNLSYGSALKIQPKDHALWTVGGTSHREENVGIHFEAQEFGALRLDIEIFPYKPKIDAARFLELESNNVPKAQVMKELREHLINNSELMRHFIVKRGHYGHMTPSACEAVRFTVLPEKKLDRNGYGEFCLDVVKRVAPLINDWLAKNKERWKF